MTDARPPLKSYTFEGYYSDDPDESGPRTDCVLAPDRETAIRLAAAQVLSDNTWTLGDSDGYRRAQSLTEFHDNEITISYEWVQKDGPSVCPNCTSDQIRPSVVGAFGDGTPVESLKDHECRACGALFEFKGFGTKKRADLEAEAWREIDSLDRFERLSLAGDPSLDDAKQAFDDDPDRETAQTLLDTAELYFEDGMIECGTWEAYLEITEPYLTEREAKEDA